MKSKMIKSLNCGLEVGLLSNKPNIQSNAIKELNEMAKMDDTYVTRIEEVVTQYSHRLIEISDHLFANPEVGSQ